MKRSRNTRDAEEEAERSRAVERFYERYAGWCAAAVCMCGTTGKSPGVASGCISAHSVLTDAVCVFVCCCCGAGLFTEAAAVLGTGIWTVRGTV